MMIDLRSDSLTQPDAGMRAAIAEAELGDDVYGEDPAVARLEERAATLLGQEAAVFVPSGTMANLIAFLVHTQPGDSVILSDTAHSVLFEGGGMAAVAGLLPRTVAGTNGKFTADQAGEAVMQIDDPHFPQTRLVVVENTTNRGGGVYYTYEETAAIAQLCRERGLKLHCDGARFFNATVASGTLPEKLGALFDSVYFSLSKGLGCPAGAVLAGSEAFIHQARRRRKMLGGGLRQAGVLAAAGLYALDHGYIDDLAEDHRRAARFREGVEASGHRIPQPSPTNMVYVRADDPFASLRALAAEGVLVLPHDYHHLRIMTHRGIDDAGIEKAIEAFCRVVPPAAG